MTDPFAGQREAMGRCLVCDVEVDPTELGALVQRFPGFEPVCYCPWHAGKAAQRKQRPRRHFRLTRDERAAMLADEHPRIERDPGAPELEVGAIYDLTPHVWITITRKGRNKRGRVQYRYTLHDQRLDLPHLLRRNPPAHADSKETPVQTVDPAVEALAAEESAYTSSQIHAVENEPEAVSDLNRRALAMSARLRQAEREAPADAFEGQVKSFADAIRGLGRRAARSGVDAGAMLAPLLRAYEQQVEEAMGEDEAA